MNMSPDTLNIARDVVALAKKKGAQEVAASANRARGVSVEWREGRLERITEATTRELALELYVDGRYSAVSTSDLRPEALETFVENAVALTRTLAADPFRSLPDPALYQGRPEKDLQLEDPGYDAVSPQQRRAIAQSIEEAARSVKGSEAILSVTSAFSDSLSEGFRVHSNGFEGARRGTHYAQWAEVSVKDDDGRRPEESADTQARHFRDLGDAAAVGRLAAERALGRRGSKQAESKVMSMALDNRASRFVSYLLGPLSGASLQQKRSFLEGKLGQRITSDKLTIEDDPFLPRGFGSRLFDGEGISAKRMPIIEGGVLRSYFIDTYYGKKLKMAPTTSSISNLAWKLGDKAQSELLSEMKEGILVTGFLGGNSNGTTGDFSLGVQGFRIRGGKIAEPVAETNVSGNHLNFWERLVAVGNDPYPYSRLRAPTLVFEGVQFAGN
jgi:PmbA protein